MVKAQNYGKISNKGNFKKKDGERTEEHFCDHCEVQGHLKESCFKLNGYFEWYVELLTKKIEKKMGKQVNMAEVVTEQDVPRDSKQQDKMTELIKQEITKLFKTTQVDKEGSVNFITIDFAGMTRDYVCNRGNQESWIIDTWASNHIA